MFTRDRVIMWAAAAGVLALCGYLVWADAAPDYRGYQKRFRAEVARRLGPVRAGRTPDGVEQIWLPALGTVDRCTSCHLGVTWRDLKDAPPPFAAHPPGPLEHHPIERFGCTLCHGGQGAATRLPDAHGWVEHWEDRLLDVELSEEYGVKDPHAFIQIRCNTCHRYTRQLKGAEYLNRAKALVEKKGCRGCHVVNGRVGSVGPDLTRVGEKTPEQYDYARLTGLPSVFSWHVGHLQDPKSYSPGTVMPNFGFTSDEAQALTLLLLSWRDVRLPPEFLPGMALKDVPTPEEAERERVMRHGEGKFFVEKTCFVCHDVSSLGIESATKIGPDLALAVDDAPRRFGRSVGDFLRAPSGTMQVVLSRQIILTDKELEEAIRLLGIAYQKHQQQARAASRPASQPATH